MHRRYIKYLTTKYEPLYRNCEYIECGDGWFNLLKSLSELLCTEWLQECRILSELRNRIGQTRYNAEESKWNPIITEFMIEAQERKVQQAYSEVPIASQVKEKFGSLRFYADNLDDRKQNYIDVAEALSASTCDFCGDKGKIVKLANGYWLAARCKKHRVE